MESPSRLDTLPSVVESRNAGIGIGGGIHGGGVGPVEFLGPTSISNFFRELNGQLLPSTQILDSQAGLLHTTVNSPGSLGITLARSHAMGMAVEVLQCIPDQETCSMLIRRCQSPVDGWIRPTLHRLSNSLHDTFRPHDNKARRANLTQLAHTLAQNASKVIEEGHEDMEQWLTSITGPNLRWECVGVLFCYWATASIRGGEAGTDDLSPGSMGWSQTHERQTYSAHRYMQCIHHCIDLCGRVGPGSTLLVHLLLLAAYLTSIQHGDASK